MKISDADLVDEAIDGVLEHGGSVTIRQIAALLTRRRKPRLRVVSGGPDGLGKCRPRPPGKPQDHPAFRRSDGGAA